MKRQNIAIVTYCMRSGGTERVISILSNRLSERYNIFIIILVDSPSFYDLKPSVKLLHSSNESKESSNFFTAFRNNYKTTRSVYKLLKEHKIDLCIGFLTANNIYATIAAKRAGIPVIICERNNPHIQSASTPIYWRILRRIIYPMADILTVQTERVRMFYSPFMKENQIVTIPNPLNPEFTEYHKKFGKKKVILNVGRLERQKAQDVLIQAFGRANLKDWQLHIIGDGTLRNELSELISNLDMDSQVFLLGKKRNVSSFYLSSSIFAFSSVYEGFPNALLEAMYFGLPCVSTDCPTGPSELIQNDFNGILVPVNSIDAMAEKLKILARDEELRNALGQQARVSVEPYQVDNIITKWSGLIEELLDKST